MSHIHSVEVACGAAGSIEDAFLASIEALLPRARRLATVMLDGRPEVEDALQEGVAKAWKKRSSYDPGRPIEPWFLAIVANECRMYRRSAWWSRVTLGVSKEQAIEGGQPTADVTELRAALRRLSDKDRLVLALRYYADYSFDEIAATIGVSRHAAKSRTARALKRLRMSVPEDLKDD